MNYVQQNMENPMDLNELFRRHQLALIAVGANELPDKRAAAERKAEQYAAQISALRPVGAANRAVLSAHTFAQLAGTSYEPA